MSEYTYKNKTSRWRVLTAFSLVVISILFMLMKKLSHKPDEIGKKELVIYCAAGIRLPLEDISKAYSKEFNIPVRLEYSSSGELEAKLSQDSSFNKNRADLYIPADDSFTERTANKGITAESLPAAEFKLVLAVKPDSNLKLNSVKEIFEKKIPFAICTEKAGAGKKTAEGLKNLKLWEQTKEEAKVVHSTVTECANSIKSSNDIQAGFIWDTTARQFGLKIIQTPELSSLSSTITVNLVAGTQSPAAALHLARYISSPEKGSSFFEKYGFKSLPGDSWSERPRLNLYCGGVTKNAVSKTISEFEKREGVTIEKTYAGCGTLVSSIAAQTLSSTIPDVFMTCDKTYMDKVNQEFLSPADISSTNIVILVRKSNPKNIKNLQDLARPDIKVGTSDKRKSTLGYLSWQIFEKLGIKDNMESNVTVTSPTSHELMEQFMAHDKLDAVLVYKVNCSQVQDEYHLIDIDHPLATVVQNVGISKKTHYPLMMSRLIKALKSVKSKTRFEQVGFKWMAE